MEGHHKGIYGGIKGIPSWCWLNPKARVDVKTGQLKAIKVALRLSQHPVHALMFRIGYYFWSLTTTIPILRRLRLFGTLVSRHKVHIVSFLTNEHFLYEPLSLFIEKHAYATWSWDTFKRKYSCESNDV